MGANPPVMSAEDANGFSSPSVSMITFARGACLLMERERKTCSYAGISMAFLLMAEGMTKAIRGIPASSCADSRLELPRERDTSCRASRSARPDRITAEPMAREPSRK